MTLLFFFLHLFLCLFDVSWLLLMSSLSSSLCCSLSSSCWTSCLTRSLFSRNRVPKRDKNRDQIACYHHPLLWYEGFFLFPAHIVLNWKRFRQRKDIKKFSSSLSLLKTETEREVRRCKKRWNSFFKCFSLSSLILISLPSFIVIFPFISVWFDHEKEYCVKKKMARGKKRRQVNRDRHLSSINTYHPLPLTTTVFSFTMLSFSFLERDSKRGSILDSCLLNRRRSSWTTSCFTCHLISYRLLLKKLATLLLLFFSSHSKVSKVVAFLLFGM